MEISSTFMEMAAVLALAAALGMVGLLLKQPLIVAFIATGLIAGPDMLGIVSSTEHVVLLAQIGVAVLLFLVGLKLDLHIVRSLGAVAVATGLGQVAFTAIAGFFLCLALGLDIVTSAYVAIALTFSSTIIIVKLLSDKREVDSLHGRIAIGFLIVQDIAVVIAMIVLSALGLRTGAAEGRLGIAGVLGSGVVALLAVSLFIRYAAEPLVRWVARTPELLVTFALAWAIVFAAACDYIGLGKELGGLLAGVSLASTSYREAIASRLTALRDFLLLFFFIALGSGMRIGTIGEQVPAAAALSVFVLVGNPLIVMAIMGYMGYRKRTGFLAGLTVAQISEFSLVFMAMGISLGHAAGDSMSLVTLVGLVTITLSTYLILYSHVLYRVVEPYLEWFERRRPFRESDTEAAPGTLPLAGVRWAVIATPPPTPGLVHEDARLIVMNGLRAAGFDGRIAVRSHGPEDARDLPASGADVVLSPFIDAAMRAVELLGLPVAGERGGVEERHRARSVADGAR